ncbi:MAG: radical SAM protein [Candidatus Aminicenantes bacterium]|nr:radical SAM protein [Candidatus Aminicenantes bacterium]
MELNNDYPEKSKFYRFPWSKNDNPIGWLEVTDACNIHCKGCYRQKLTGHKSFEEIKEEVLLFKKWRNCDNISISGGEPLIHPKIEETVAFIHENNIKPILLTNAVLLDRQRLHELKKAGLKGLTIHIDSFQKRPGWEGKTEEELNELRLHYADMIHEARHLFCSFNATIYHENFSSIPIIVKWANKHFDRVNSVIFITYRGVPLDNQFEYRVGNQKVELKDIISYTEDDVEKINITTVNVYNLLKEHFPYYDGCGYLGGTASHDAYKWFVGAVLGMKDRPFGFFGKKGLEITQVFHHLFNGTYPAYMLKTKVGRKTFLLSFFDKDIRKAFGNYLKNPLNLFRSVYVQSVGIIQAPDLLDDENADMCDSCPDMTWYDGKLINSCRMDEVRKFGSFIHAVKKEK